MTFSSLRRLSLLVKTDIELIEDSLISLEGRYQDLAQSLFEIYIAEHPQFAHAFINPETSRNRMTTETIEVMVGTAAGEWWVDATIINFVDLHHNYDDFSAEDYGEWFTLVIQKMAEYGGDSWPIEASAAWHRQASVLVKKINKIREPDYTATNT